MGDIIVALYIEPFCISEKSDNIMNSSKQYVKLGAVIVIAVGTITTITTMAPLTIIPSASAAASSKSCDNFSKSPRAQANYNPHCLEELFGPGNGPPVPSCNGHRSGGPDTGFCRLHPQHP